MKPIDRRQGLWMLAGGAVAVTALGARAMAQEALAAPGRTLALIEKSAGRVAFYALPDGRRLGTVALDATA